MKKQSIAIIGVVAFVLAVAIGYALFSDVVTIKGTAKANGSFDMDIMEVDASKITSDGYVGDKNFVTLSDDDDTLTISIDKLHYPGAWVKIPIVVKNTGSIPAKLKSINQTEFEDATGMLTVTYTGPAASDTVIQPGEEIPMTILAVWDESDSLDVDADEIQKSLSVDFEVTLVYEQVTVAATSAN